MDLTELNRLVERGGQSPGGFGEPASQGPYPLSYAQESLWFFEQMSPGTAAYNIPEAWELKGPVDLDVLQRSLDEIVRRHEILRTIFQTRDGKPEQMVLDNARIKLELVDLLKSGIQAQQLPSELNLRARQPIDLTHAPLARATLFRIAAEEHVLLMNVHHIISDAWSQGLLMRELAAWYKSFALDEACGQEPLPIQYADFALWQREMVESRSGQVHFDYWTQRFPTPPKPTLLASDRRRKPVRAYCGQTRFFDLPPGLVKGLRDISRQQGATLYMTLLAGFKVLLHRHTREQEILIGAPMACRDRIEVERLLGLFVNTHALRTDLSGDPTFIEALHRVREVVLQAYAHQEIPSELLVKSLPTERSFSGHPLFHMVFGWQNSPPEDWKFRGVEAKRIELDTGTSKFDWTILATECSEGLRLRSEFSTDLFEPETIGRLLDQFEVLLKNIVASPGTRISEIPLQTSAEHDRLVFEWNRTDVEYERESRIHEVFEMRVAKNPEALALVFEGGSISYEELNKRANQLAHRLRASGVIVGMPVGICLARSPGLIVGILAILKAGGAYVPLDSDYPAARLDFILQDAGVRVLVTDASQLLKLKLCSELGSVIQLDNESEKLQDESTENLQVAGDPINPAYVMYTSGSTGAAKGTLVPHRAVVRLVRHTNYVEFSSELVFLQSAPISFDASTFEIWGALLNGARLVILTPSALSLEQLGRTIQANEVTTLWLTAGLFDQMIEDQIDNLRGLKHLLAGGDILSPAHVSKAVRELPGCQIINGYGPTENTTFTCCFKVSGQWPEDKPVPIGQPIANTRVYVLDDRLAPVPVGMPGELYAGGDGLALGYLNKPALTSEKFIPNPFAHDNSLLYKTGDQVRWAPDGNLEFLGRVDAQVKIRGYRVEPGEIENALGQNPSVAAAVVVVREDKFVGKQLVAYVVARPGHGANPKQLRDALQNTLPSYLIPSHILVLKSMPLTANGKIDRRALPEPYPEEEREQVSGVGPRSATEELVGRIWCELLGRAQIGVHEDFFRLGGHSLVATQLVSRLSKACNLDLPVRSVFEAPTIARLSDVIDGSLRNHPACPPSAITRSSGGRAAEILERLDELTEAEIEALLQDPQLKSVI